MLAAVNKLFGRNTILCKENGGADLWRYYWPWYRVLDIDSCMPIAEQTAMGMGVIGTCGTKLARPEQKVVCLMGDGAMNMAMMELATARGDRRAGVRFPANPSPAQARPCQHGRYRCKPVARRLCNQLHD